MKHTLVVLSGGQDSVTTLGYALQTSDEVSAISFYYNQRHKIELECASTVCNTTGVNLKVVNLSNILSGLATSALTGEGDVSAKHPLNENLPASFVPGRNALFLTLAHAYAQQIGAECVATGVCQTDYSGYPDCRQEFISSLNLALNKGYQSRITIVTPLMYLSKAETFQLAEELGFLDIVLEHSHTCYEGDRKKKHEWGYGCGVCPACKLREAGWEQYKINKLPGA